MLRTSLKALKPTVPVSLLALTNYLTSRSTYRSYSLSSVSPTNESLENDLSALSLGSNAAESTNTAGTIGSKDSDSAANRKKKSPVRLAPLRVIMDIGKYISFHFILYLTSFYFLFFVFENLSNLTLMSSLANVDILCLYYR